jgi:predicted helicase
MKVHLSHCERAKFSTAHVRKALYRPFTRQALYYDALLVDRPSSYWAVFPTEKATKENCVVSVNMTPERPFVALATNLLPESVCTAGFGSFSYCLPLFTYSEDGKDRRDNITPKARWS